MARCNGKSKWDETTEKNLRHTEGADTENKVRLPTGREKWGGERGMGLRDINYYV